MNIVTLLALGLCTMLAQTVRFKATKLSEASKLQPYAFTRPMQQYITDSYLFNNDFTFIQVIGLSILISVYVLKIVLDAVGYGNLISE